MQNGCQHAGVHSWTKLYKKLNKNKMSIEKRRVVVTGLGALTPVGNSAAASWAAIQAGRSGIGQITRFDTTGCPTTIAGEVRDYNVCAPLSVVLHPRGGGAEPLTSVLSLKDAKKFGRWAHLGLGAAIEAYADSGLDGMRAEIDSERIGVNVGVGLGAVPEIIAMHETWKAGGYRRISPFFILQTAPNILSGQLAILLNLRGPNLGLSSACATSGHALGESARMIERGDADVMFAGGAESVITPLGIGSFAQMKALSTRNDEPARASRPFDKDRDGFVLSEGAVVFVLEEREHALKRGARVYAELCGYGATADAYHISMLAPEAEGSRRSMRLSLKDAGIDPSRVGFVSAHATSTPGGDTEEAAGIAGVFGESKRDLHVSSVKSMVGHLLGAAGAMGAFVAVKALECSVIPPTINLENIDPVCGELGLDYTPNVAVPKKFTHALANSFGFGGTNCSLVFGRG